MTLSSILLVLGVLSAACAIVCLLKHWITAAVPAYAALCLLHWSTSIYLPTLAKPSATRASSMSDPDHGHLAKARRNSRSPSSEAVQSK